MDKAIAPIIIVVTLVLIFFLYRKMRRDEAEVKPVITEFMEAGAARNVGAAYACCSPHSPTKEEIAELIESSYDVFAGYERFTTSDEFTIDTDGDIPKAFVKGAIIRTGREKFPFKASLVKENDVWRISGIQIGSTIKGVVESLGGGPCAGIG